MPWLEWSFHRIDSHLSGIGRWRIYSLSQKQFQYFIMFWRCSRKIPSKSGQMYSDTVPKKYNLHQEWSGCIGTLVSTYMTGTQTRQVPLHPVHPSMTGSTYIRRFRFLWEIPLYLQLFFCFQVCLFICVHCTVYYLFNREGSTMKVTVLFTLPLPQSNLTYHNNLQ